MGGRSGSCVKATQSLSFSYVYTDLGSFKKKKKKTVLLVHTDSQDTLTIQYARNMVSYLWGNFTFDSYLSKIISSNVKVEIVMSKIN